MKTVVRVGNLNLRYFKTKKEAIAFKKRHKFAAQYSIVRVTTEDDPEDQ